MINTSDVMLDMLEVLAGRENIEYAARHFDKDWLPGTIVRMTIHLALAAARDFITDVDAFEIGVQAVVAELEDTGEIDTNRCMEIFEPLNCGVPRHMANIMHILSGQHIFRVIEEKFC